MTNNIYLPSNSSTTHGTFTSGFVLGILVGGAGLFLFATDEGKKIRQKINQEWLEAQDKMLEDGVIDEKVENFADLIKNIVANIARNVDEAGKITAADVSHGGKTGKKSKSPSSKKVGQKKAIKFRGV